MNDTEMRQYLKERSLGGIVLGLDTMRELMNRLGNPQDQIQWIHVAGTNGKGSIAAFVSQILGEAGYPVGRYCSPAVFCEEEKIQTFSGETKTWDNISREEMAELMTRIRGAAEAMESEGLAGPTVFELETAMAFCHLARKQCAYAVLETGMGGDLDATNVVKTVCCSVFSSISIDHSRFLGDCLEEIAGHKAGIIKPGRPVVMAEQKQSVESVIKARCEAMHSTLWAVNSGKLQVIQDDAEGQTLCYGSFPPVHTSLVGVFQRENISAALETVCCLREEGVVISEDAVKKGIQNTVWPGRMERVGTNPWIFLDGAHNPDAAEKLAKTLQKYFTNKKIVYIMGVLADKDYPSVLRHLGTQGRCFFTITPKNLRALGAERLREAVREKLPGMPVEAMHSVREALTAARREAGRDGVIVACGSLSFLREFKTVLGEEEE